jgi:flagellar assembly protein FliH
MSVAPARFTFDLDLGRREDSNGLVTESAVARLLDEAREAGFTAGFEAGEQGVNAKAAKQLAAAAGALGDRVAALAAAVDDIRKSTLTEAVDLAAAIAHKLASNLVSARPTGEIEALVRECLATLDSVPHLVIRCHTELADAVRAVATQHIEISGFGGRLVVMGDPEIALGDCRLEWVDGGLVRDQAATAAEIDRRIAAFLAARGIQREGADGAGEN